MSHGVEAAVDPLVKEHPLRTLAGMHGIDCEGRISAVWQDLKTQEARMPVAGAPGFLNRKLANSSPESATRR